MILQSIPQLNLKLKLSITSVVQSAISTEVITRMFATMAKNGCFKDNAAKLSENWGRTLINFELLMTKNAGAAPAIHTPGPCGSKGILHKSLTQLLWLLLAWSVKEFKKNEPKYGWQCHTGQNSSARGLRRRGRHRLVCFRQPHQKRTASATLFMYNAKTNYKAV